MRHSVRFADEARKHFERLDADQKRLIAERVDALASNPYDRRLSKPPRGNLKGLRSSRVGGRRIIYTIVVDAKLVYVLSVDPRRISGSVTPA